MWGSDMMGEPTLEHVQAYVLLSVLMVSDLVIALHLSAWDRVSADHQNNKDRASAAWGMLGLSVKVCLPSHFILLVVLIINVGILAHDSQIAQNIGLSRLGAEQQAPEGQLLPTWTGRWESLIQREVGRRVWWNLVFMEWSLAPSYYFSVG